MYPQLQLYIDGAWSNGNGRDGEEVINPATEKPLAHLPHASIADLLRSKPPARASPSGARPPPTTARRSCARPPT